MVCKKCGKIFSSSIRIGAARKRLNGRANCLDCSPFKALRKSSTTAEYKRDKFKRFYLRKKIENGIDPVSQRCDARKLALLQALAIEADEIAKVPYTNKFGVPRCQFCNYSKIMRNLAFHHLENKSFEITSREMNFSLDRIATEVRKCVVACHNCHGEIHENLIDESSVLQKNKLISDAADLLFGKKWSDIVDPAFMGGSQMLTEQEMITLHVMSGVPVPGFAIVHDGFKMIDRIDLSKQKNRLRDAAKVLKPDELIAMRKLIFRYDQIDTSVLIVTSLNIDHNKERQSLEKKALEILDITAAELYWPHPS